MQDCENHNGAPVPEPSPAPSGEPRRSGLRTVLAWVRDLALSAAIAVVLIVFIYQPVKVEGTSMTPALQDQERIFIEKFTYRFGLGDIARGDTVVFRYPLDPAKSYIKRVVGIPGDRVRIDQGQVYVNGRALVEDYVAGRDRASWPSPPDSLRDRKVPAGKYFVLGDNRMFSSDSRSWGFVPRENIYGKAVFAYWPLNQLGRLK
jgi:signal peptidase I